MGNLKRKRYEELLEPLEEELVAMARWAAATGQRIVVLFEGRDTAGKGGTIKALTERVSPRIFRVVALPAPSDREKSQMYLQRYMAHFPAAGEVVIFDRSWYNRAGVERVMGFAKPDQVAAFLAQAPQFEKMLVDDGVLLFKYWLACDQAQQEERLAERLADPLKRWKLSPIDLTAREKYGEYTAAREAMMATTHTPHAPWTIVDFNDQRLGRLTLIRDLLDRLPDTHVDSSALTLAPLAGKMADEEYAVIKPIAPYPV